MALTKVTFSMIDGPFINVKDYGAVGNGTTNDTAAVLLAVAASAGKVLVWPAGTYVLNNAAVEPASNSAWFVTPNAVITNVTTSPQYNIFPCIGVTNWSLYGGGTLQGYVVNDATANGYILSISEDCDNIKIDNINFVNAMADCIYIGTSATAPSNIWINNITTTGARRNGLAITAGNNIRITNSIFQDTYNPDHVEIQSGLDIEPDGAQIVSNVTISGCNFLNNYGCGITVYGGASVEQVKNILIDNNTLTNNCIGGLSVSSTLKASLEVTRAVKTSITNNSITGLNNRGGISCDLNRETVVQSNDITGEGATATTPQDIGFLSGLLVNACNNMVVVNNNVKTSNYHGIYLYQSTNCIVSTNVADNSLINGLVSQSNTNCIVSTNILSETQQIGLLSLNDNHTQFLNNTIVNNNLAGFVTTNVSGSSIRVTFSLANTPTNIKVMGNTVRTSTTTPTYPLNIGGANVTNCVACPNDFRGTFVNAVTDTGTGTILTQANVINLT